LKARLTSVSETCVVLEYDCDHPIMGSKRLVRTFYCVRGFVHEETDRGDLRQVCDRLAGSGRVLLVADRDSLMGIIRREYRALVRAQRQGLASAQHEVRSWSDCGPTSYPRPCLQ